MPVIVVGADTDHGRSILLGLEDPHRDVRAFVSDEEVGAGFKRDGIKVALGDVSDESHVAAAASGCFTAVLMAEAASDARERAFATSSRDVLDGWARAMTASDVTRVIWVSADDPPSTSVREVATVAPGSNDMVERVVALDEAQVIGTGP